MLSADALAADPCTGHKLLRTPRPELSCNNVKPRIYPSPDGTSRALVYPVDISLNATPDLESRVVIRSDKGETLTSKDYASPRGFNGYYVVNAKWSPDFEVLRLQPVLFGRPFAVAISDRGVQSRQECFGQFSDMIDGKPSLSADFKFTGPHTLIASTWKQAGALDDRVPVTVDLEDAFGKLPPSD